ncbi:polyadenylate-binding protein 3-like [Nicotiana sylvestris]|uniref:Polyadenylate-binding protein n=1 Tax=Nicotiana sylvestris TaxID=4096 RepID=A0A1U7X6I9_NICSY|nr:PREDICTED: polyadenylate-binding protein 3-like isoform X2 [Nicotiana sylvestris]
MAATAVPPPAVQTQAETTMVGPTPPPTPQVAIMGGGGNGSGGVGVTTSTNYALYVGDLDTSVEEGQLYEVFNHVAQVVSVRVCRDQSGRSSLGYAYVNFTSPQDAATARELLNFTQLNGKPMRIMFSHRDPSLRKSGYANVFIKNLDSSIDNKALYDTFAAFGTVLSCKVAADINGQSKGYGFVQFDQDEAAHNAIKRLNGMLINDKQVYVGHFIRRQERSQANASDKFTNVYVKDLPETTTDEDLKKLFEKYGTITSAVVMKDKNGKSKCFGFVNYESSDAAVSAVEQLNGSSLKEKVLYVGKAQKKSEREAKLKAKFEQERASRFEKLKGANLYLKNLDSVSDENLKELFSEYGTITSCKVMRDSKGVSKGSGFVAFSTPEEATRALNEMNGKLIGKKPLFVAVAQRKDERRAWLQAHFARMRPAGGMAPPPGAMSGFHNGAPRLAPQQVYFGQGAPGLIAPQAAEFGFQQQLMPGLRPGVGPNFLLPYQLQRQGQHGRVGGRRGGNSQQQQQWNSGRFKPNGRNGMHPSITQGMMGSIMPAPFDASAMTSSTLDIQRTNPVPPSTLASSLAFASPEDQHRMLGEQLFPLVERIERDHAGKVTGMLLEMDQTEVLHLIESSDALNKKVSEAMDVLRLAGPGSSVGDKFGSLTLNG